MRKIKTGGRARRRQARWMRGWMNGSLFWMSPNERGFKGFASMLDAKPAPWDWGDAERYLRDLAVL